MAWLVSKFQPSVITIAKLRIFFFMGYLFISVFLFRFIFFDLYGCSFAQRCILKKQSRTFLTDQREVNRTKTRKNMFFLILFGFYHVFLTGRTAAKNNIQFQPYSSFFFDITKVMVEMTDASLIHDWVTKRLFVFMFCRKEPFKT